MSAMTARQVRFLLVEDDDDHAELIKLGLLENQVTNEVYRVTDGAAALEFLRGYGAHAEQPRPDIVLLDLKLPRIDGHEVLEAMKSDERLRDIPVVVLTTSRAEADKMRAYQSYAHSYLTKPFEFEEFHQMIKDLHLYWSVWNEPPSA